MAGLDSFLRSCAAKCVEHYVTTEVATSRFIQFLCVPSASQFSLSLEGRHGPPAFYHSSNTSDRRAAEAGDIAKSRTAYDTSPKLSPLAPRPLLRRTPSYCALF